LVTGVYTELQKQLQSSTNFSIAVKAFVKSLIDGFRYHPYIFMLRQSPGGKDAIHPFTHQVELLYKLFYRKPLKVLIGDEIGLGKTIEAIMLLKYLQEVGEVRKTLVLVPRVLVSQWEGELRRFGIEPLRIERDSIENLVTRGFPEGVYLASIDLVKREKYKSTILSTKWDLVIVDEAHRVGIVGGKKNARYVFLEELISRSPIVNLVLLSATPHRGKVEDYIQRLRLLDPSLYAGVDELDNEEFYKHVNGALVFRRTKLDVNKIYEKSDVFKPCEFIAYVVEASEEEKEFHEKLLEFLRSKLLDYYNKIGEEPRGLGLLLTIIAKRASSSPVAAIKTFEKILLRRGAKIKGKPEDVLKELEKKVDRFIESLFMSFEEYGELFDEAEKAAAEDADTLLEDFADYLEPLLSEEDFEKLRELVSLAMKISMKDQRLAEVVNLVKEHLGKGDRVVVFTEFKDTAEYVYDVLLKKLPSPFKDKVCLVTASKIEPPRNLRKDVESRKYGIEDVKEWLKKGLVDVIVSTDVASEGLNLQHASIVVHYEPTWSPIKIVQRIGRVWRVGQEKNVYSYSVLLTVESDLAVLENLYGKLLSWLIAGVESKVVIGEKLRINFLRGGIGLEERVDVFAMPITGDREERGYSEYRAIIEFIRDGRKGLERYVSQIISMLSQLKRISRRVESERVEKAVVIENIVSEGLGGLCRQQATEALKKVLEALAHLEGCAVEKKSGILFISCPNLGVPTSAENLADVLKIVNILIGKVKALEPVILLATTLKDRDFRELHLFEVVVKLRDRAAYSEVIGVGVSDTGLVLIRGTELLSIITEAIQSIAGVADIAGFDNETIGNMSSKVKSVIAKAFKSYIAQPLETYIRFVESRGLGHRHDGWEPTIRSIVLDARWISSIFFLSSESPKVAPPPIKVEEVERKAMEFVMEFEKKSDRVPEDVSMYEHYDIRSYDPRTGEVRYIEVKGRWEPTLAVELTETEFEYAKKLSKDYWLYIVYDIGSGNPRLVMIRDPVNNVIWKPVAVYKYKLVGMKREASETN